MPLFAAPIAQGLRRRYGSVEADVALGVEQRLRYKPTL